MRWITFGHVESDECGSMNPWLEAAPKAQVVHGRTACLVSLDDLADRAPRVLANGEVLDLGGRRVRYVDTPHVPHAWESGLAALKPNRLAVMHGSCYAGDCATELMKLAAYYEKAHARKVAAG